MNRLPHINAILAFVTVARAGSVSRAADSLNLTQPAVSHQIRRLSQESGLTLFQRGAAGLNLTADGAALLPKAEQVLAAMQDFRRSAQARRGQVSGRLSIGTVIDPEFIRLGQLLMRLRAAHPQIETKLTHGVSGDILDWLQRGRIDAGFYLSPPDELPGADHDPPIHAIRLAGFSYRVIAPAGWQEAVQDADWPALARLPWIGTPEVSVHHRLLSRIFARHGCTPQIVARVDQEASMLEMVRSGIGLSLCRESIALHQQQTAGLAVAHAVFVPAALSLATLASRRATPEIAAVLAQMPAIW